MSKPENPLRIAVIGMGGFAQSHHRTLQALEEAGECRLVATCDPSPASFAGQMQEWRFGARGVRVHDDYLELLDSHREQLDVVTVPTPVPLHRPMHRACVERGLACYLEKPPTLFSAELEEMLAEEERSARLTSVGFNFIVETPRQLLKARILAGEFGRVRRVTFRGLWPRSTGYFTRAGWAGRLLLDGRPVLDSCIGNAMAHYLHNVHFWCGQGELLSWEEVAAARAELYRAHAIEGFDTCFVAGQCDNGVEMRVAVSHACDGPACNIETVICKEATITYVTTDSYRIRWHDEPNPTAGSREETAPADRRNLLLENFRAYFAYLRGEISRPLTRLIDSRPFVHFNNLVYLAAGRINTVPEAHLIRTPTGSGADATVAIADIQATAAAFCQTGLFPGEQGAAWGGTGGEATPDQLPELLPVVRRMADASR